MSLKTRLLFFLLVGFASCTTVKTDTREKEIYAFFQSFKGSLAKSDEEILKHFQTAQSSKAILAVIRILQNKDDKSISCNASFTAPHLDERTDEIVVSIPVDVSLIGVEGQVEQIFLPFHLTKNDEDAYVITRIEGEQLYNTIQGLKSDNEWVLAERAEIENRSAFYATAQRLEQQYDSVIWYVTYNQKNFFYVVDSAWTNYFLRHNTMQQRNQNVKMGLCDSTGTLIIPMEYNLIGTIGFERPDLVEVTRNGKVGYFDVAQGKLIIEPLYDEIIPYEFSWVVKSGETYGWIDEALQYSEGFPSDTVKQWFENFAYLRTPVRIAAGNQAFCEIPTERYAGNGIVIPSSYLVRNGLFDYIESGIVTSPVQLHAWTEYKEGGTTILEKLSGNIQAMITTVRERYLEGREEFYTTNKMVFFNNMMDTLTVAEFDGNEISYRSIDSTLLEVSTPQNYGFEESGYTGEYNTRERNYISLADGKITRLTSTRYFAETEFVKLDSSYLVGKFYVYDPDLQQTVERSFLSEYTINNMRNDILAAYGYIFPDQADTERFSRESYSPKYNDIKEFEDQLTKTDKHNLAFLEKVLTLMKSKAV